MSSPHTPRNSEFGSKDGSKERERLQPNPPIARELNLAFRKLLVTASMAAVGFGSGADMLGERRPRKGTEKSNS